MAKVNYKVKDSQKLTAFIKRFSVIEPSLLLEIEGGLLKAKTHTPERSVVKSSKINLDDIFYEDSIESGTEITFGIFNTNKFVSAFKHFGSDFNIEIEYDKLDNKNVGTLITLSNDEKKLQIKFECASTNIFTHITDEIMEKVSDLSMLKYVEIDFDEDDFSKLASLFSLDGEDKLFQFKIDKRGVNVLSKSFKLNLKEVVSKDTWSIKCFKHHFNFADKEASKLIISEDKLLIKSDVSDTICVVAKTDDGNN